MHESQRNQLPKPEKVNFYKAKALQPNLGTIVLSSVGSQNNFRFFDDRCKGSGRIEKVISPKDLELCDVFSDYLIDDECVAQQVNSEWLSMSNIKRGNQEILGLTSTPRQVHTPDLVNNPRSDFCSVNLE